LALSESIGTDAPKSKSTGAKKPPNVSSNVSSTAPVSSNNDVDEPKVELANTKKVPASIVEGRTDSKSNKSKPKSKKGGASTAKDELSDDDFDAVLAAYQEETAQKAKADKAAAVAAKKKAKSDAAAAVSATLNGTPHATKTVTTTTPLKGKQSSSSSATVSSSSGSKYVAPTGPGPHFRSSRDPELDDASKALFRFGRGRNLVAIGPAKVRDPHWLPPPPGLSLQHHKSTAAVAGVAPASGGGDGSGSSGSGGPGGATGPRKEETTLAGSAKEAAPARARVGAGAGTGTGAVFAKKGGSGPPAQPINGVVAGAEEGSVQHSSPFSFSFNGL
jgi:hypothetical protein